MTKMHIAHPSGFILCREFEKKRLEPYPEGHGAVTPAEKGKATCQTCIKIAEDYLKQIKG